jgi:predicted permease
MRFFENLAADVRYAMRSFGSSPGFTAAAITAIAVGIGINTGLFTVLNGFMLREVAAPDSDELVSIHQIIERESSARPRTVNGTRNMFSFSEYETYRNSTRTLSGVLAYNLSELGATLGGPTPRELQGTLVSCNYFDVLRVTPTLGRSFAADTCENPSGPPEVVLAHEVWLTSFGGDPAIVGQSIVLNRQQFVVAGVAPEGFAGIDFLRAQYFAPISAQSLLIQGVDFVGNDDLSWLNLVGRRIAGATLEQVRTELGVIGARIDLADPGRRTTVVAERATPLLPDFRSAVLGASAVVMAGFALVLLIACANVANLLLARSATRGREIGLRLSLGATRLRLIQQFLTESVLISLAGGALGSLLAIWSFQALLAFVLSALPPELPRIQIDPRPDLTVLAFAVGLTTATGVVFGLAPALHASRPDQYTALKHDSSGAVRRGAGWSRNALVGVQVAVCLVLAVAASLLLRGLYAAEIVEPGFAYRDVAVVSVRMRSAGYDEPRAAAFNRELLQRVAALPGVMAAAQTAKTPLSAGSREFELSRAGEGDFQRFLFNNVSPGYFALLDLPLVRGRDFTEADLTDTSRALIVSAATARRFWPGEEPVGKLLDLNVGNNQMVTFEVVGVSGDAQVQAIGVIDDNLAYLPASPRSQLGAQLLVRSDAPFAAVAEGVHGVIAGMDATLSTTVTPLEDNLEIWRTFSSLAATLASGLGALALVLAGIGVYGQVSYAVNLRLREIGIRIALGASARQVLRLVVARNARPVVLGLAVGAVGCLVVGRSLSSFLFGVSVFDPLAIGAAAAMVLGAAFVAVVLPTRRALGVDPTVTLRHE